GEAVGGESRGGEDRELERRALVLSDRLGRLCGYSVVARPSRIRRPPTAVATEHRRALLARLRIPCPEIRDLPHRVGEPATAAAVVVGDDRRRGLARAERGVAALSVPRCMEAPDARADIRRSRDPWAVRALAGRR